MKTKLGWALVAVWAAFGAYMVGSAWYQRQQRQEAYAQRPHLVYAHCSNDADAKKLVGRTDIQHMAMYGPQVKDEHLATLAGNTDLQELTLLNCPQVTDAGLVHIAKHKGLKRLMLDECQVTDEGLVQLASLQKLEELSIGGDATKITDSGLAILNSLPNLKHLVVGGGQLSGAGLVHLAAPCNIEFLSLYGPAVTDESVQVVSRLTRLKRLNLYRTTITDQALQTVAKCATLEQIWLTEVNVTDAGLQELSKLTGLKKLDCRRTGVTADGVAKLTTSNPQVDVWTQDAFREEGHMMFQLKLMLAWVVSSVAIFTISCKYKLAPFNS